MKRLIASACVAVCVFGGAACDGSHTTSNGSAGTAPGTVAGTGATGATRGPAIFAHSCSSCHSLIGNESERKQGGDLLGDRLTRAQLTSFTRVMPARLTAAQLRAVVDYVLRIGRGAHGKGLLGLNAPRGGEGAP